MLGLCQRVNDSSGAHQGNGIKMIVQREAQNVGAWRETPAAG